MRHEKKRGSTAVSRHRAKLRAAGFRPLQIWVPDTASPRFAAECRRQSLLVAKDPHEQKIMRELEAGLGDMPDWKA